MNAGYLTRLGMVSSATALAVGTLFITPAVGAGPLDDIIDDACTGVASIPHLVRTMIPYEYAPIGYAFPDNGDSGFFSFLSGPDDWGQYWYAMAGETASGECETGPFSEIDPFVLVRAVLGADAKR